MKKTITAICCTAMMFGTAMTAHAAEVLDRDYIESEIWEDMWHGKGDDGTTFPEASYKHHLLDEWLNDNYGSDEYDWSEIGELKYEYKRYYQDKIEDWDFNDDDNGNWTIDTSEHSYSFTYWQNQWIMTDENGNTVESFLPFSTLEDVEDSTNSLEIHDDSADSPRVIGKVAGGAEKPCDSTDTATGPDTTESLASDTESNSVQTGASPLMIGGTIAAIAAIGGIGFYIQSTASPLSIQVFEPVVKIFLKFIKVSEYNIKRFLVNFIGNHINDDRFALAVIDIEQAVYRLNIRKSA